MRRRLPWFFVVRGETTSGRSMEVCPQNAWQHTGGVQNKLVLVKKHMMSTEGIT